MTKPPFWGWLLAAPDTGHRISALLGTKSTLTVAGDYSHTDPLSITNLNGGTRTAGHIEITSGIFAGVGSINGNVSNGGTLNLAGFGSTGILTINGDYTQTAAGTLHIKIGGTTAGAQYDQLIVNGTAMLGGELSAVLINGFSPPSLSTYDILIHTDRVGTFASTFIDGFIISYDPAVTLTAP